MRKFILAVVFLAICPLVVAQQVLNNDSIIKLVKAGLSDDLIVSTINASPGAYDTTADGIIALKSAGASDKVVAAIVQKSAAPPPPPIQAAAPAPAAATPSSGMATVYIYRHKKFEGSALKPSVFCDSTNLGRVASGRFLEVKVPAGEHVFHADLEHANVTVNLEAGKDYYFIAEVQVGFWKGHFRLMIIMPEQGKSDVAQLQPSDRSDAVHEVVSTTHETPPPAHEGPVTTPVAAP